MTEILTWWSVQFALNFMDFVIMYFISHKMMKQYMKVKWFHVGLAALYTLVVAPIGYFDGNLLRVASAISLLFATKLIIKRAEMNDLIMIYVMSLLSIGVIQIPVSGGVWVVDQISDISEPFSFLISQAISTVIIILLCRKFHWYKWFNAIKTNGVLKLLVCLAGLAILIPMAIINFEYNLSYFLLLTLGIVLAGSVLVPTFIKLYQDVSNIISVKELESSLFGMWLDMADEQDIDVFKEHFKTTVREFDIILPTFSRVSNQSEQESRETTEE